MDTIRKNYDKITYFLLGLCLAFAVGAATSPIYGIVAATVIGLIKEIYNYFDNGEFDRKDMYAAVIGGITGIVAYYIFKIYILCQMAQ